MTGSYANRYTSVSVPTMLLTGEKTDNPVYLSPDECRRALPHAQHSVLAGQRHIAFASDPTSFAATVLSFTQ